MLANLGYTTVVYLRTNYLVNTASQGKSNANHFTNDELLRLCIFFIGFCIVFLTRLILRIYLICKWSNKKIDPTFTEANITFYSFFTLGLFEIIVTLYGLVIYFSLPKFLDKYDKTTYDYDMVLNKKWAKGFTIFLIIYGSVHTVFYIAKALMLIGVYSYFKFYGGLEDDECDLCDEENLNHHRSTLS